MSRQLTCLVALLCLSAPPTAADFFAEQATYETADAGQPELAASDEGWTMLAYHAEEPFITMSFVRTQLLPSYADDIPQDWPPPQTFSSGGAPQICWSREGFTLAFVSGDAVLIYQSDRAGQWDLDGYEMFFPGGAVMGLDLWGVASEAAGPHVFLTITTSLDPPDREYRVHFAARTEPGWSGLIELAQHADLPLYAQVTWSLGGYGPWPTVFYLGGDEFGPALFHRTHTETGWTAAQAVALDPMPLGGEFDVDSYGVGERHVLGLGPQPTCPCGTIHHLWSSFSGGWSTEHMTRLYGYMDWPMSPRVAVDADGRVHAFWYQQSSDEYLVPHRRTLEYWLRERGTWTDAGAFLDSQPRGIGSRVALDLSPGGDPVLAWTRRDTIVGEPQPRQVWIARKFSTSPVPDDRAPRAPVTLRARPNPFNPRVNLLATATAAEPAALAVYDARGRCLRRLPNALPRDACYEWTWDGTDETGRAVPGGVYFARVTMATARATCKLVLAR